MAKKKEEPTSKKPELPKFYKMEVYDPSGGTDSKTVEEYNKKHRFMLKENSKDKKWHLYHNNEIDPSISLNADTFEEAAEFVYENVQDIKFSDETLHEKYKAKRNACKVCGEDAMENGQYYVLENEVWEELSGEHKDGLICFDCIDKKHEELHGEKLPGSKIMLAPASMEEGSKSYERLKEYYSSGKGDAIELLEAVKDTSEKLVEAIRQAHYYQDLTQKYAAIIQFGMGKSGAPNTMQKV